MADMNYSLKLSLQDSLTKGIREASKTLGGFAGKTAALQSKMQNIKGFKKQQSALAQSTRKMTEASDRLRQLGSRIAQTKGGNAQLSRSYGKQLRRLAQLRTSHQQTLKSFASQRKALQATGVDLRRLDQSYDATRRSLRRWQGAHRASQAIVRQGSRSMKAFAVNAAAIYTPLAIGAYAFKRTFLQTAIDFEKFTTVLETVEGSSAKAQKSMDWISNFAAKTPYELTELTDSFVKLKAYGIDPIANDTLKVLGDTASAMGKPITQAVEAIADAVTGENERLKEFGIKASVKGDTLTYSYTSSDGSQAVKVANKNNRTEIQKTLLAIWNEKYAGAMDKQSKTFAGMVSNLSDQWTRFQMLVMKAGVFDDLKSVPVNDFGTLCIKNKCIF